MVYIPSYVSPFRLRSLMGSSYYSRTLLITNPTEDALARRVNEMSCQLEALRMKSERPYENDFNTAPTFTSKIMEELISPRFKMS